MHSQQVVVSATCYNAVVKQTNKDVSHTASMFDLDLDNPYLHRIVAISRDLESKGFHMGDIIMVCGTGVYDGLWIINDRMNKRFFNKIDFLVNTCMTTDRWSNINIIKQQ